jgi:hypothetical protein
LLSLVLVFCFILLTTPGEKVDLAIFFAKRLLIGELLWLLLIIKLFSIARLLCRLDNPKRTESM